VVSSPRIHGGPPNVFGNCRRRRQSQGPARSGRRLADGLATTQQMQAVRAHARHAWDDAASSSLFGFSIMAQERATHAAYLLSDAAADESTLLCTVIDVAECAVDAAAFAELSEAVDSVRNFFSGADQNALWDAITLVEQAKQCVVLRNIFGNPFQVD